MGKTEDIESERKPWESDEAWQLRRAFLVAHYDDYPRLQLQCLSQLFININVLGCEYSPSLMQKMQELGRGITPEEVKKSGRSFVKASEARKRVPAAQLQKESEELSEKKSHDNFGNVSEPVMPARKGYEEVPQPVVDYEARIKDLKVYLAQTGHHLTGVQMLNSAAGRCRLSWKLSRDANNCISVTIDDLLVFKHTFSGSCKDAEECSVNALIETFLSCEPSIVDKEIKFGEHGAEDCYAESIRRSFKKVRSNIGSQKNYKGLSKTLEAVNIAVAQNTKHLQGWSQQLDIVANDVLLATRVLSKAECTRPKMLEIVDEMSKKICSSIASGAAIQKTENSQTTSLVLEIK